MNSSDSIILPAELLKKVYFLQYGEKEINKKKIKFSQLKERLLNLEDFFSYFPEKRKFSPINFTHFSTIVGGMMLHPFNIHICENSSIKVMWNLDFHAEVLGKG